MKGLKLTGGNCTNQKMIETNVNEAVGTVQSVLEPKSHLVSNTYLQKVWIRTRVDELMMNRE